MIGLGTNNSDLIGKDGAVAEAGILSKVKSVLTAYFLLLSAGVSRLVDYCRCRTTYDSECHFRGHKRCRTSGCGFDVKLVVSFLVLQT